MIMLSNLMVVFKLITAPKTYFSYPKLTIIRHQQKHNKTSKKTKLNL